MNKTFLQGNVTRDPETKYLSLKDDKKTVVCNFTLAMNRHYNTNGEKKKETTFIDCQAWDRQAEIIAKYVRKGHPLLVEGSLKNDNWVNAEGNKRSKLVLRVLEFELAPKNSVSNGNNGNNDNVDTGTAEAPQTETVNTPDGDDIPF